ncbi:hypothetical protein BSU04_21290 [Caballeronia sordidicola]|uniref:Uncharacterized protein n=1 Tax=Caballeronia sordidicola TaxID=196367 RepID=A0A226WZM3_CABSO|nr:hypothetical protein BSU04_21290 [Caballeronia sordidicola]
MAHAARAAYELPLDYPYDGHIGNIDTYLDRNPVIVSLIVRVMERACHATWLAVLRTS